MKENIVTFQVAKLAKEKGFNVECGYGYTRLKELMTIDRSQESFFGGASRNYRNSELESYNKSYLECNDDEYVCIYTAPTQSLLQKWLRQIHNINVYPILSYTNNQKYTIELRYDFSKIRTSQTGLTEKIYYDTYEEALEQGLFEGLKLIK